LRERLPSTGGSQLTPLFCVLRERLATQAEDSYTP
jgi:hypothetical protein